MDEYNTPNRSPNPEGRFTLFPGKGKPTTYTLTPDHRDVVADLARRATERAGKSVSKSDVIGAAIEWSQDDIVDWIVGEVRRRDEEAAGTAEGGTPATLPAAIP